jgi:hypothetical protein
MKDQTLTSPCAKLSILVSNTINSNAKRKTKLVGSEAVTVNRIGLQSSLTKAAGMRQSEP